MSWAKSPPAASSTWVAASSIDARGHSGIGTEFLWISSLVMETGMPDLAQRARAKTGALFGIAERGGK